MNTTYYRTGKGSKRHASVHCANGRRSVFTGEPIRLQAREVKDWAPCKFCCTAEEVAAHGQTAEAAAAPEAAAEVFCANTGVKRPGSRRMYDNCRDCGKEGAVNPKTGTLRKHKPAAAAA
ncbi:MAG: hypothetical protein HOY79_33785 [Streptomyces sp.]|nr:hypothetical protein [Streptomyces sp.]NUS11336.1 hypothetical protein [Streptomyces sp.]NUS23389.1 hypothetical protein [Streptomyces sp.]